MSRGSYLNKKSKKLQTEYIKNKKHMRVHRFRVLSLGPPLAAEAASLIEDKTNEHRTFNHALA